MKAKGKPAAKRLRKTEAPGPREWSALLRQAQKASTQAYCPYSNFSVGAAVLDEKGRVHGGCNVENASYGLTCCAERNAVFAAVAAGARVIRCVVIYTPTAQPTSPCGACRQVLREFGPEAPVVSICDSSEIRTSTVSALLPDSFGPEQLT